MGPDGCHTDTEDLEQGREEERVKMCVTKTGSILVLYSFISLSVSCHLTHMKTHRNTYKLLHALYVG